MGGDHAPDPSPRRESPRAQTVHMHVGLGGFRGKANLTQEDVDTGCPLDDRVAQIGIARVKQGHTAGRIILGRPLNTQTKSLNRVQGVERTNRHRANLVGLPHLQVSESKFSFVALILRGALDLTDAMHRLRRPKQGHGPEGTGAGTPLAVHLQRNDVTHMVGMAV